MADRNGSLLVHPDLTDTALGLVVAERERQDEKWNEQRHEWTYWLAVLIEEVGEFAKAIVDYDDPIDDIRTEAIHVAAVAVAIIEHATEDINGPKPDLFADVGNQVDVAAIKTVEFNVQPFPPIDLNDLQEIIVLADRYWSSLHRSGIDKPGFKMRLDRVSDATGDGQMLTPEIIDTIANDLRHIITTLAFAYTQAGGKEDDPVAAPIMAKFERIMEALPG